MNKIKDIRVRVTKNQLERIKMNAQAKGFISIASYMRFACLEQSQHIESKILENNKILNKIQDKI